MEHAESPRQCWEYLEVLSKACILPSFWLIIRVVSSVCSFECFYSLPNSSPSAQFKHLGVLKRDPSIERHQQFASGLDCPLDRRKQDPKHRGFANDCTTNVKRWPPFWRLEPSAELLGDTPNRKANCSVVDPEEKLALSTATPRALYMPE